MVFVMESTGVLQKISREYKGVIETLSDIGGIKELIHMVFILAYALFHARAEKNFLIQKIYNLVRKPEDTKGCCRRKTRTQASRLNQMHGSPQTGGSLEGNVHTQTTLQPEVVIRKDGLFEVSREIFEQASKSVEKTLDVVSIAKELNCLRILVHYLLRDY